MSIVRSLSVPPLVLSCLLSVASSQVLAQQELSGSVTDESGSALARVAVRLVDQRDSEVATTFTDSRGVFHFTRACDGCAAVVSLPGFNSTRAAISNDKAIVLTLHVAPVQEAVVGSAFRRTMDHAAR